MLAKDADREYTARPTIPYALPTFPYGPIEMRTADGDS
jgi:hypothetical protein